jgi:beta-lactam-binding protein with PASTA domain
LASELWPVNAQYLTHDTLVAAPAPVVPPPAGPPLDRRIGAGMLLALGVLGLALVGVAAVWWLSHRSASPAATTVIVTTSPAAAASVAVPKLVGLQEAAALEQLTKAHLRARLVFRPSKAADGTVIGQSLATGVDVSGNTQVGLVVASGKPAAAIPDVRGRSVADARAALNRAGFKSVITQVSSDRQAGTVVDEAPSPGSKLAKGSQITLSIATNPKPAPTATTVQTTQTSGTNTSATSATTASTATATGTTPAAAPVTPQTATVPDVTGQPEAAAVDALGKAGILASLFFVPNTDPLGTVEEQAKAQGASLPYQAHMQINVSQGPGQKEVEQMPNLIGKTLDDAVTTVNAANLRLIYLKLPVSSRAQAGKIVQQSPLVGAHAPRNAQVLVFLGAFRR